MSSVGSGDDAVNQGETQLLFSLGVPVFCTAAPGPLGLPGVRSPPSSSNMADRGETRTKDGWESPETQLNET